MIHPFKKGLGIFFVMLVALFVVLPAPFFPVKEIPVKNVYAQDEDSAGQEEPGEAGGDPGSPDCPECPDPAEVVLRGLEEKKERIAEEQKVLEQKREELERFEEQIDEKLEQLADLKKQVKDDIALFEKKKSEAETEKEAAFEAKMNRLVKVYAGMKPKNAAGIVNEMDINVAQEIFSRMRETAAAQILADVNKEKAAKISEGLARKNR